MVTSSGNDAKDGAAKVSTSTSKNPSTISTTAVIGSVEETTASNRFSSSDVHLQQQLLTSFSTVAIERNVFEMTEAFRKGVMVEIETMKDSLCRRHSSEILSLKEAHGRELASLNHQLSRQLDLNNAFTKTLANKEETIENLLECLRKEKEKDRLARFFVSWREKTREGDAEGKLFETPQTKLARKHREFVLRRRVWSAWLSIARAASREKFEARVREETREKLETMEKECDARMLTLQATLRAARAEVEELRGQRESHEERVKAALMRGVCALNVETMSVLSGGGGGGAPSSVRSCGSADGSLNASSIHAMQNGTSPGRRVGGGGGGGVVSDTIHDHVEKDYANDVKNSVFKENLMNGDYCLSSTPEISPFVSAQKLATTSKLKVPFERANDSNPPTARSNSSHSFYTQHQQQFLQQQPQQQHMPHTTTTNRSTSRSSAYQSSSNRRSCGVNPIGNLPKEKGAQIKSLPHNTIVIERHVDRS